MPDTERPSAIAAYVSAFSLRFRLLLQYRAAAWAGFGTQTFFGLIRVMVFAAFFASSTQPQPMNFAQVMSYIWLGQVLFALLPFREDHNIATLIRNGNIAYEFVRPVHLFWFWLARQIANQSAPILLRALPMLIVSAVVFPLIGLNRWALHPPESAAGLLCFALMLLLAILLSGMLKLLATVSLFWTINGEGLSLLLPALVWPLCGIILPLSFYPDWSQPLIRALPFRGLMDVPFQFYIGSLPPSALFGEIARQCAWIAGLGLLSYLSFRAGTRRVVVQGG